ncbi:MAG: MarR family transcriptional regulator [Anaerocolumna sp.]|jgi:DNA-binding MarR family transcriptional regulator|nr:MarR family transcriptional regulator [Anaerocolumna sp.]
MDTMFEKGFIFGGIFVLANRLQLVGDKFDEHITVKQWLLLACISKYKDIKPTLSDVAKQIGNSRQNVKKMALILEREGFLTISKDHNDARILRISLTEKCDNYFKEREEKELQFINEFFYSMDDEMIKNLYQGITKLSENISRMELNYVKDEKE